MQKPILPLPKPWTGVDPDSFARHTVLVRFPDIARRTVRENDVSAAHADAVERLIAEILDGGLTDVTQPLAPDTAFWTRELDAYIGRSWLDAPWFLTETYFYRRLLMALGFWQPGGRTLVDPFALQKRGALEAGTGLVAGLTAMLDEPASLLAASLWANRVDLSLWPTGSDDGEAERRTREVLGSASNSRLIVDDRARANDHITSGQCLHIVLDNTGAELIADLMLAAAAITAGGRVVLHAKSHPTFVSDATPDDVVATVDLIAQVDPVGRVVDGALATNDVEIDADPFWVSPHPMWEAPRRLVARLAEADLILVKGDANYRRLLGDRQWRFTDRFADIVRPPAPLAALRTIKSEVAAGLPTDDPSGGTDAAWLTNGEWGLIQYAGATTQAAA